MLDLLDLLLLKRGLPSDDRTLSFRRIDGDANAKVIYFLPWHTPFGICRQAGFTPLDFLACYEMPCGIVSSDPELGVKAMRLLVADAEALLTARGIAAAQALIVGLSVGTYPAIYLANRIGARLCAVAAADRGDLMLWQSPPRASSSDARCSAACGCGNFPSRCWDTIPPRTLRASPPTASLWWVSATRSFHRGGRRGCLRPSRRYAPGARVASVAGGHVKTLMMSALLSAGDAGSRRAQVLVDSRQWATPARPGLIAGLDACPDRLARIVLGPDQLGPDRLARTLGLIAWPDRVSCLRPAP